MIKLRQLPECSLQRNVWMILAVQQHWVVPDWAPTWALCTACIVSAAAWAALHLPAERLTRKLWRWPLRAIRLAMLATALLAAARIALQYLVLDTPWSLWSLALAGAAAVEVAVALYRVERKLVSRPVGSLLLTCRIILLLAAVVMLLEPVRPINSTRKLRRRVAILVDDSASMHIVDGRLTADQKVRLAEAIDRAVVLRRHRLEFIARRLEAVRSQIAAEAESLGVLADARVDVRGAYLADHHEAVCARLAAWRETLDEQLSAVSAALEAQAGPGKALADSLGKIKSALTVGVAEPLAKAAERLAGNQTPELLGGSDGSVLSAHRRAATVLAEVLPDLAAAGRELDAALYRVLPAATRARVDEIASRTRSALARHVLLKGPGKAPGDERAGPGLLELCERTYEVSVYTFSAKVRKIDPREARPMGPGHPDGAAELPGAAVHTNLARAIERVCSDISADVLAGVIVLTDGRHNAPQDTGPVARRLAMQGVPVFSVVFGSERGPVDAAVVSVQAPESIHLRDRTLVTARLKLDGLAGRKVRVKLKAGAKVIDSRIVDVPADRFRTEVQLADEPKSTGPHAYSVVIEAMQG